MRRDGSTTETAGPSGHVEGCACVRCTGFLPENAIAVKSGATSEQALAPLRVQMDAELAADYGDALDPRRRALLADRLSRVALARAWLDEQGTVVRDEDGRVFDVVDRLEKWSSRAETILAELEAERRAQANDGAVGRLAEEGPAAPAGEGC